MVQFRQSGNSAWGQRSRRLAAIGAFAFFVASGLITSANAVTLETQGNWHADAEVIHGQARCSMSNNDPDHYVLAYYLERDDHLSFQIGSKGWQLARGQTFTYTMQFDQETPWTAQATSGRYTDGSAYIDVDVKADKIVQWMDEFMKSHYLVVSFSGGRVAPWVVDLYGTRKVSNAFLICINTLLNPQSASAQ